MNLEERLIALLEKAEIAGNDKIEAYERALEVSVNGYRVIHKRDVDEIYVNNYNPEWIRSWNANMDIQLCLDYFAVITYISDYYSKDDSGTMKHIKEAMKQARDESLQSKLALVVHQFLTHRQIGESEAYFRLLQHLHMKHSNIEAAFIQTGFKDNRSKFLKKLTDEEAKYCTNIINVTGRKGLYTEKPSLIDKYMRRDFSIHPDVFEISYLQFGKRYVATKTGPKQQDKFKPKELEEESVEKRHVLEEFSEIDFIVTHDFEAKKNIKFLPKFIKINDPKPGEPSFMKLRSPIVARMHKFSQTKHPHEFYFSELQLYKPFTSESELGPDSLDKCKKLYDEKSCNSDNRKVINVKSLLMIHLAEVEEGKEKAREVIDSNAGTVLDPQKE